MRYSLEQKKESREKLLQALGRGFRKRGFGGIGVDGLAKEAKVTSGAFYSHFDSKDAAFQEALIVGLEEAKLDISQIQAEKGDAWLESFIDIYMSHRRTCDLSEGCALQTLTPDVVRAVPEVKLIFELKLRELAEMVAMKLKGGGENERFERALTMLSILSGGVTMARAVSNPLLSETIAKSIRTSALQAARGSN